MKMKRAIVFGRGIYYEKKRDSIEESYEITAFLDNAVKPHMTEEQEGRKVYNPQDIYGLEREYKIILASNKWFEMWKQLMELGVEEERIVFGVAFTPYIDVIEDIFHDEKMVIASRGRILCLKNTEGEKRVSDEKEYKAIVRELFAKKNPYIKLISDMPLVPVSRRFGQERGNAIDRYYIEKFLSAHKGNIKGTVMEIAEKRYINMFPEKVSEAVVLHVNGWGEGVVQGNLATGEGIGSDCVDCLICTQTVQFIYDIHSVIKNIYKLLKPGGTVMLTASAICQISLYDYKNWGEYWRFTDQSMRKWLSEIFEEEQIQVYTYGNMKAAAAFMFGLCLEEMNTDDLEYQDEQFPMIIAAVARKV